jgi:DNA-binding CsgD family transcriptional regulator/tetratricopeptide (TPR) repeat protein
VASAAQSPNAQSVLCRIMIGREAELEQLQQAWHLAGQLLLVRGSAGIGKSRLVAELAAWARSAGGTVVAGRCSPTGADVPLRPLRESLLTAARTGLRPSEELAPFLPALGSLVPEWVESGDVSGETSPIVLAEGVLRLLSEWSTGGSPSLLVVEDAHWSDRETLKVIEYLADNLAGHPVLVVVTMRSGETGPSNDLVDVLLSRRAIQPIDLRPLNPAQAEAMVSECLSAMETTPALVDAVVARSDGVPFFVEELLATAVGDTGSDRAVPRSIRAALETRLASLSEETVEFLRFAAVLGRQFDWHVVAAAVQCTPQDAIDRLRQAARTNIIDMEGGGFRFRHALTVDAVTSSLLPEELSAICLRLSSTLEALHPDLEAETCQLAATLAFGAGDLEHASDLWIEAARRAMREGSLASAEALALRAQHERPFEADRALLSIWTLAGQPRRALEAGQRILSSDVDPVLGADVRFELLDSMIAAGRWDDAESYLATLRARSDQDGADHARLAVAEAEVALARNDKGTALAFARAALADSTHEARPELICRSLWVIGRVERGRDTAAAFSVFEEAYECASRYALPVLRIKALLELGTIDMYESLGTSRLEEARRDALAAGALSTVAMVDLQLAAIYSCRGQAEMTLAAAARSEEMSRQFGLASLPMSVALRAVAHGFSGNRSAMEAAATEAAATQGDNDTVRMITLGNGVALYHLGEGQMPEAIDALDRAMEVLRAAGGGAHPFPGRWALLRTVADEAGAKARDECRLLEFDTEMSRATLWAADAVVAGREGRDAASTFDSADRVLARFEGGFLRSMARLLVAPCAHSDGWGEPAIWLREALVNFEDLDLPNFAGRCRVALRSMGEPVPRRPRSEAPRVSNLLAARGVTPREAEVLAQIGAGRSNREIAELLHLSIRTVEKHVERILMKTGNTRSEVARLAEGVGTPPTV